MIATFWPSSRRLAISPPQESAASSGWGATKTWVMAGRVYQAAPPRRPALAREALRPDERDEHARAVVRLEPLVAMPPHQEQVLAVTVADRDDEPPAVRRELLAERRGDRRRGGGHDDSVPRRSRRVADAAIPDADLDRAPQPEPRQPLAGERRELRLSLDRQDPRPQQREDR